MRLIRNAVRRTGQFQTQGQGNRERRFPLRRQQQVRRLNKGQGQGQRRMSNNRTQFQGKPNEQKMDNQLDNYFGRQGSAHKGGQYSEKQQQINLKKLEEYFGRPSANLSGGQQNQPQQQMNLKQLDAYFGRTSANQDQSINTVQHQKLDNQLQQYWQKNGVKKN